MSEKYLLAEETLGYVTAVDETNADKRLLATGSKNVLIDRNRKVKTRAGFIRFGAGNASETPVRNGFTWNTSTATELPLRFYDDEWEVYFGTVDGTAINAWTRIVASMSTTEIPRGAVWWDTTENIDVMVLVQGDDNLYEWNGAVAIVSSITGTTVTKTGTTTFAQNRFYATRNMTVVCVRTGTEYTYTGGASTTTLTGIADTTGLVAGDTLIQKIVTQSNKPAANRNNHTIHSFENQICVGSEDDNEVYVSKNSDYTLFTYSSPRVSGEGGLLTLDAPARAIFTLGARLCVSAGRNTLYQAKYTEITVGTTLAETLSVEKLDVGVDQGVYNQETLVNVGNAVIYLSFEPAVRMIHDPSEFQKLDPKTLSNPIKPDFDAETWTNACATWYKNSYFLSAPTNSRVYILDFVEDADGKVRRFWNPPQTLPVRAFSIISDALHGHSNSVAETYELFSGVSDLIPNGTAGNPADKLPVECIAAFTYNNYGDRANDKTFDEYYVDGEITTGTNDLLLTLNYDFGGATQVLEKTIDGSDGDILEGNVGFNSLGQQNLGVNPLGGLLNPPDDARKFAVVFEVAKEDFRQMQAIFSTYEVDRYWSIISHGANAKLSPRKNLIIRK